MRHPIQNILAHSFYLRFYLKGIKQYFQYQTYNQFTIW